MLPEVVAPGHRRRAAAAATWPPARYAAPGSSCRRATTPRAPSSAPRSPTPAASTSPPAPGRWSASRCPTRSSPTTTQARNITNEGGYAGTIRLLRNVTGLWILQPCRRDWAAQGQTYTLPRARRACREPPGCAASSTPTRPSSSTAGTRPRASRRYCAATGSPVPQSLGEIVRCVVDSLALSYRAVVDDLHAVTGQRDPERQHRRRRVQQHAAVAADRRRDRPAGALRAGRGHRPRQRRHPARRSRRARRPRPDPRGGRRASPITTYQPQRGDAWDDAYQHLTGLLRRDRQRRDVSQS